MWIFIPFQIIVCSYSNLCSLTDNLSLIQVVGSNTYISLNGSESLIDLVFLSSLQTFIKCSVIPGLGNSDHCGIYLLLRSSLPVQHVRSNNNKTIWRYDMQTSSRPVTCLMIST